MNFDEVYSIFKEIYQEYLFLNCLSYITAITNLRKYITGLISTIYRSKEDFRVRTIFLVLMDGQSTTIYFFIGVMALFYGQITYNRSTMFPTYDGSFFCSGNLSKMIRLESLEISWDKFVFRHYNDHLPWFVWLVYISNVCPWPHHLCTFRSGILLYWLICNK